MTQTYEQTQLSAVDNYFRKLLGRPASQADQEYWANYSEEALLSAIRKDPAYASSAEYGQAFAKLNETGKLIWNRQVNPKDLDWMIRQGWSLEHAIDHWRSLPEYKAQFPDKPDSMDETGYRQAMAEMNKWSEASRDLWQRWHGQTLDDKTLHMIYLDPNSAEAKAYNEIRGHEAARNALLERRGGNTLVKMGRLGPYQQTMKANIDDFSIAPNTMTTAPSIAAPPTAVTPAAAAAPTDWVTTQLNQIKAGTLPALKGVAA